MKLLAELLVRFTTNLASIAIEETHNIVKHFCQLNIYTPFLETTNEIYMLVHIAYIGKRASIWAQQRLRPKFISYKRTELARALYVINL